MISLRLEFVGVAAPLTKKRNEIRRNNRGLVKEVASGPVSLVKKFSIGRKKGDKKGAFGESEKGFSLN